MCAQKLNVVGEELRRDYKKAVYISNTTSYGWPWGPRVKPKPDPLVVQYKKDNERARVLLTEQTELEQRLDQLSAMSEALEESRGLEHDVKQNLAQVVQATQELNSLLDRLEGSAELQGAPSPVPVSTSPAELDAEKLPGSTESPTSTLQGSICLAGSLTDSSSPLERWRWLMNVRKLQKQAWEVVCKAVIEGCAAVSTKLRQAVQGDGDKKLLCTDVQWVQQRMVRENLSVDLVGISGKKLVSQRDLGQAGNHQGHYAPDALH
ncbi:g12466 [Coccomyxa viridis]|uniref:G12466 protein n=1 Tax=Coccomyxa viridis TaxID=1274662 RepID=A0ABP1GD32_9CHLO